MTVSEIMSRDVMTVTPDSTYRDLCKKIFTSHIHTLPVVAGDNKLVGIVTRRDILERIYPKYQDVMDYLETPQDFEAMEERIKDMAPIKAKDIMSKTVIFARETTLVMRALSRMIVRHVDQLPILNDDDQVVGMVTKGDIFYSLFRKHMAGERRPDKVRQETAKKRHTKKRKSK